MTPRPQLRCFGTPYYWERRSATEWEFDDGWGTYRLTRQGVVGWFLATPEDDTGDPICDGIGEYVGDTITAAANDELTLKTLTDGHHRRKK